MEIIPLSTARALGLARYFTGKPCKHLHIAERLVSNGTCLECSRIAKNSSHSRELENAARAKRRLLNPEPERSRDRVRRSLTPEIFRERDRLRWANGRKEQQAAWLKDDRKKRPWVYAERARARKKKVQQATPRWLTKAQRAEIVEVYRKAAELTLGGSPHHVDHIVPLSGKNVCGLHVPWNLQVLTAEANLKKRNEFTGDLAS